MPKIRIDKISKTARYYWLFHSKKNNFEFSRQKSRFWPEIEVTKHWKKVNFDQIPREKIRNSLIFWPFLIQNLLSNCVQKLSFSKIQNELKFCIMFNPFSATLCKVLSRFVGNCTRWRMVEQKMSLSSTSYVCFRDVDEKGHWPQFSWGWEMVQGVQASFSKFPKLISMLPNFYEL